MEKNTTEELDIGDFVKVTTESGVKSDYGVVSYVTHNEGNVYYEVTFFDGDSKILTSDKVIAIEKGG